MTTPRVQVAAYTVTSMPDPGPPDAHQWDVHVTQARVLMVMLADIVADTYEPSTGWLERRPLDQFGDDDLDDLYDRLECAQQTIAAYQLREQPETWQRQAALIVRQAKEIGDLKRRIDNARNYHPPRLDPLAGISRCAYCLGDAAGPDGTPVAMPWPCPTWSALDADTGQTTPGP
jgi:hypothetical protein